MPGQLRLDDTYVTCKRTSYTQRADRILEVVDKPKTQDYIERAQLRDVQVEHIGTAQLKTILGYTKVRTEQFGPPDHLRTDIHPEYVGRSSD